MQQQVTDMKKPNVKYLHRAVQCLHEDLGICIEWRKVLRTDMMDAHGKSIDWQRVEEFLETLSDENLFKFCVGYPDEMSSIAMRGGVEGQYAAFAINALWEQLS